MLAIRMGISDDIKPKIKVSDQTIAENPETPEEPPEAEVSAESQVEIPIDKSGQKSPVFEDIIPQQPKPFEHLEKEAASPEPPVLEQPLATAKVPPRTEESLDEKPVSREDSYKSFTDYHQKQPKKSHLLTIIIILFVLLLATLLILQNIDQIKSLFGISSGNNSSAQNTGSGIEVIGSQDYTKTEDKTVATDAPATSDTETKSTEQTAETTIPNNTTANTAATAPTTKDISTLALRVLNGNGITGSAATVKDALIAAGYTVGAVANATRFTYTNTIIYYNTGLKTEAEAVATVLSTRQTEIAENPTVAGTNDLVVVVGKN